MLMYPRLYHQVGSAKWPNLFRCCSPNLCKQNNCWYSALLQDPSQLFYGQGWIIWCHSKFYDIPFFSLTDCEWLYNIQLKTRRGGTLFPPYDAYVRSLLYLLYTLIKLHYTKALSNPASSLAPDWIRLLRRPRIPAFYHSPTTFSTFNILWHCCSLGWEWKKTFMNSAEFSYFAGILSATL